MATAVSTLVAQHENHNHQPTASQTATETHLKNLRQLTFGGDNAEAYWSFDSKAITFQSNFKQWGVKCDQIFTSLAFSPKIARSNFSSGVSVVSPFGVTLPTSVSPGWTSAPT